jgi:hypothetical protein
MGDLHLSACTVWNLFPGETVAFAVLSPAIGTVVCSQWSTKLHLEVGLKKHPLPCLFLAPFEKSSLTAECRCLFK